MSGLELYVLGLTLLAIGLFVSEVWTVDLVGLLVMLALVFGGVLDVQLAFTGFANKALLTVGALFVVGQGVIQTGAVGYVSRGIAFVSGGRVGLMFPMTLSVVMLCSAFISNTPVVVLFLPIMLGLAERYDFSPSKVLIPISFASILGGTCTLIGTSTNILINTFSHGQFEPLRMFEFLPLGLVFSLIGLAYLTLFSFHLLPDRRTVTSLTKPGELKEYLTEIRIVAGSASIGKRLSETISSRHPEVRVLELIRGERILWPQKKDYKLRQGDILMVKGDMAKVVALQRERGLELLPELAAGEDEVRGTELTLAEVVLTPNSKMVGRTLEKIQFRKHHGAAVMAIQRAGAHLHLREKISQLRLRTGDILLVQGDQPTIHGLRGEPDFLLLEGSGQPLVDEKKAPIAACILLLMVLAAASGIYPISLLALTAAFAMVVTRCLSARRAYQSISWEILVLIACMIALGKGMETTGLARTMSGWIQQASAHLSPELRPYVVLSAFYLLITILSSFISHAAAAILFVPLVLQTASTMGVSARPFLFCVAFAASAAFIAPIGYQTHMIVYGPGGYRMRDFIKFGTPLNLILWLVASLLIPRFWPF